jgi:hypothetical protein
VLHHMAKRKLESDACHYIDNRLFQLIETEPSVFLHIVYWVARDSPDSLERLYTLLCRQLQDTPAPSLHSLLLSPHSALRHVWFLAYKFHNTDDVIVRMEFDYRHYTPGHSSDPLRYVSPVPSKDTPNVWRLKRVAFLVHKALSDASLFHLRAQNIDSHWIFIGDRLGGQPVELNPHFQALHTLLFASRYYKNQLVLLATRSRESDQWRTDELMPDEETRKRLEQLSQEVVMKGFKPCTSQWWSETIAAAVCEANKTHVSECYKNMGEWLCYEHADVERTLNVPSYPSLYDPKDARSARLYRVLFESLLYEKSQFPSLEPFKRHTGPAVTSQDFFNHWSDATERDSW